MADKRRYADRRDELIRAVGKRRRKIKTMAIAYCHRELKAGIAQLPEVIRVEKRGELLEALCSNTKVISSQAQP